MLELDSKKRDEEIKSTMYTFRTKTGITVTIEYDDELYPGKLTKFTVYMKNEGAPFLGAMRLTYHFGELYINADRPFSCEMKGADKLILSDINTLQDLGREILELIDKIEKGEL